MAFAFQHTHWVICYGTPQCETQIVQEQSLRGTTSTHLSCRSLGTRPAKFLSRSRSLLSKCLLLPGKVFPRSWAKVRGAQNSTRKNGRRWLHTLFLWRTVTYPLSFGLYFVLVLHFDACCKKKTPFLVNKAVIFFVWAL